jgi:sulfate-transporting ATPase
LVLFFFVLSALVVANVRRSGTGRKLLAMRANERGAASVGVNVFSSKMYAFAISGALAGLGGILTGFQSTTVTFGTFGPITSINAVAEVVLGGVGFIFGALGGALLAPQSLSSLIDSETVQNYIPLVGGVGLLLTLATQPDGMVEKAIAPLRHLGRIFRLRRRDGVTVPSGEDLKVERCTPRTLSVKDLTVRYGGVVAVDDISFTVGPGEVVAVIGPNGAGKTSLMDALTGFTSCSGEILLDDTPIAKLSPHRRVKAGLTRSWQGLELFEDLTIDENLQVACDQGSGLPTFFKDLVLPGDRALSPSAAAAVREFNLGEHLHQYPDALPYGLRRLVAIARAVATGPSVLLLDEPAAGLDEFESAELANLIRGLAADKGMAVVVIEHDMDLVMKVADHVVVMDFGRQVTTGPPEAISKDPAAVASYLGEEVGAETQEVAR